MCGGILCLFTCESELARSSCFCLAKSVLCCLRTVQGVKAYFTGLEGSLLFSGE